MELSCQGFGAPPPWVPGAAFPREEPLLPALGRAAVPSPGSSPGPGHHGEAAGEKAGALALSPQPGSWSSACAMGLDSCVLLELLQHHPSLIHTLFRVSSQWLTHQKRVTPTPHSSLALFPLEGCKKSKPVESTGLTSRQCPSDAGRKGWELGSQQTVGGRKEGREGWFGWPCAVQKHYVGPGTGKGSLSGVRPRLWQAPAACCPGKLQGGAGVAVMLSCTPRTQHGQFLVISFHSGH